MGDFCVFLIICVFEILLIFLRLAFARTFLQVDPTFATPHRRGEAVPVARGAAG